MENQEKFNPHKFFVGIIKLIFNKYNAIWLAATYFVQKGVFDGQSDDVKKLLIVAWIIISICFFFSHAFDKMISERGSFDVKIGASINK